MKLFISHSAKDNKEFGELKKDLGKLKRDLFVCGVSCFLAHDDINPGEHDLERIKKEIANCDIFLIIGNELAKKSIYCNQEIGMAIAHKKHIISTVHTGYSPWGFIERQQAIKYKNIQQNLFFKLVEEIIFSGKYKQYWEKEMQCLDQLKIKGFAFDSEEAHFISIYPKYKHSSQGKASLWNDYGYYTEFEILEKQQKIGEMKIGYKNQTMKEKTKDKLLKYFPFLKNYFFSRCFFKNDIPDTKKEALYFLLNDIEHNKSAKQYINEDVVEKSLFRSEHDHGKFEEIKQRLLNN